MKQTETHMSQQLTTCKNPKTHQVRFFCKPV